MHFILKPCFPSSWLSENELACASAKFELLNDIGKAIARITIALEVVTGLWRVVAHLLCYVLVILGHIFECLSKDWVKWLFEPVNVGCVLDETEDSAVN